MAALYLHIGTPKTGTTALQNFRYKNRRKLAKNGIFMPEAGMLNGKKVKQNAYWLYNENVDDQTREEKFRELGETAKVYPKILLADERIWDLRANRIPFWEELKNSLDRQDILLKVVVYLRRQDTYIYSKWAQSIKYGRSGKYPSYTFQEFLKSDDYHPELLDYAGVLKGIASVIGKENLIVRVYDSNRFYGGTIFSDFFYAIGEPDISSYKMIDHLSNTSLSGNVLEAKRLLNQYGFPSEEYDIRQLLKNVQAKMQADGTLIEKTEFSAEDREAFLKNYEEGNRLIAGRYLGREDGILFYEDVRSKQYNVGEYTMEELVPVFSALLTEALKEKKKKN